MRVLSTISCAFLFALVAAASEPPEKKIQVAEQSGSVDEQKPVSFWMEKKLEYAQEMLRGMATGDLGLVATKAEQMRFLSKVEGWVRKNKEGYTGQLQAFDFANAEIERQAKADNLEGAAMAFQQLTISCVSCHSLMRNRQ